MNQSWQVQTVLELEQDLAIARLRSHLAARAFNRLPGVCEPPRVPFGDGWAYEIRADQVFAVDVYPVEWERLLAAYSDEFSAEMCLDYAHA